MSTERMTSSFASKLRLVTVMAAISAVTLASAVLVPVQYRRGEAQAFEALASQGRIIAFNAAAALQFADPTAAEETLAGLSATPEIGEATLFSAEGEHFAAYHRPGVTPPQMGAEGPSDVVEGDWLVRREPIMQDGQNYGTLVIAYDLGPLRRRLWIDVSVVLLTALFGAMVAVAMSVVLQRSLSRPLEELSRVASHVATHRDFSARARVIADDELGRLTAVVNDMLGQIQAQDAAIQRTNTELRARTHEMEQFVYTVSHDLKSPAVTITGFVGLLRQDVADGNMEGVLEAADHLHRAGTKMSELIDDLLSLSRIGRMPNECAWVDTDQVAREAVLDVEAQLREKDAEVHIESPLPRAWADPRRLAQVFDNLLTNAIKYGCPAPGGRVTIGGRVAGGRMCYFVRDNGPGIAPQYHQRIFNLFQRLDSAAEGTGVGLAIVARIAETHGGRAWVESRPGEGATFWFSIAPPDFYAEAAPVSPRD